MTLTAAGITNPGRRRPRNEDTLFADTALGLFIVADGMGGHAAGAVASAVAVESLVARYRIASPMGPDATRAALVEGIRVANRDIRSRANDEPDKAGMGTTVVALAFAEDRAIIANVGDSRAYISRNGTVTQITVDHTWVGEQVRGGRITSAQARAHPDSHLVTRAVGTREHVDIDTFELDTQSGDIFLLCSDGLTSMLEHEELRSLLINNPTIQAAAERLVEAANSAGGIDNVTVVVIHAAPHDREVVSG